MGVSAKPDPARPSSDRGFEYQSQDLSPFHWRLSRRSAAWQPPTDVYETESHLHVRVEIAGMRQEDFVIELQGRSLVIRGVRQEKSERCAYHQMEIRFGEFSIELELPMFVDADLVQAVYNEGFLRLTLPKAQPKQINIVE
jgi:HSP20 family protein